MVTRHVSALRSGYSTAVGRSAHKDALHTVAVACCWLCKGTKHFGKGKLCNQKKRDILKSKTRTWFGLPVMKAARHAKLHWSPWWRVAWMRWFLTPTSRRACPSPNYSYIQHICNASLLQTFCAPECCQVPTALVRARLSGSARVASYVSLPFTCTAPANKTCLVACLRCGELCHGKKAGRFTSTRGKFFNKR